MFHMYSTLLQSSTHFSFFLFSTTLYSAHILSTSGLNLLILLIFYSYKFHEAQLYEQKRINILADYFPLNFCFFFLFPY